MAGRAGSVENWPCAYGRPRSATGAAPSGRAAGRCGANSITANATAVAALAPPTTVRDIRPASTPPTSSTPASRKAPSITFVHEALPGASTGNGITETSSPARTRSSYGPARLANSATGSCPTLKLAITVDDLEPPEGAARPDDWLTKLDAYIKEMEKLLNLYRNATLGSDLVLAMSVGIHDDAAVAAGKAAATVGLDTCAKVDTWQIFPG
ncbi:hypothetical protein WEI85_24155 [Actinomycetes bacterium KLBMP 9797]